MGAWLQGYQDEISRSRRTGLASGFPNQSAESVPVMPEVAEATEGKSSAVGKIFALFL
jgi:hypothetical protein